MYRLSERILIEGGGDGGEWKADKGCVARMKILGVGESVKSIEGFNLDSKKGKFKFFTPSEFLALFWFMFRSCMEYASQS